MTFTCYRCKSDPCACPDNVSLYHGDNVAVMQTLEAGSVQCCVTSPPYWGLRDYGDDKQLGLEPTPDEYVANMVGVFREVRRLLRDDGTLWLNLGDSYCQTDKWGGGKNGNTGKHVAHGDNVPSWTARRKKRPHIQGIKPKDLVGIPWRVAFALQADGWYLRQDIIWHKPNPMPESVTDRCTKAHEYIFLLSKSAKYHYDVEAVREDGPTYIRKASGYTTPETQGCYDGRRGKGFADNDTITHGRNKRSVWTVATKPFKGAHFATFPPKLIEPCILAGCPEGATVCDPFAGSFTTGKMARELGRRCIGIEVNEEYCDIGVNRLRQKVLF